MPNYRVRWQSGEEDITAEDESEAMDAALECVVLEAEVIDGDDKEDAEEEEEEDDDQ